MSKGYILIPDAIVARVDLTASHKLILGILGRLQGDKGSCYPSLEYLAKASGLCRRQVSRIITDLKARKEITVLRHPYQSNSYSVPWATKRAERKMWAQKGRDNMSSDVGQNVPVLRKSIKAS